MELLLEGLPLDRVSISMTINATAMILLAMVVAVAERKGVSIDRLDGTTQNDILKEYIARGTYIYPPGPSLRLITDAIRYCAANLPRWNPISISGYHMREAGATAAQEVGFTLADALTYVQAVVDGGLDVDMFAPSLSFFFAAQMDVLEEVAKFRAARRLWNRLMEERFAPSDPRSRMLRFHTQTAGAALTAQQPDNNVARVALQALAAVLGGTQSLHTNARDEALALPTEEAALLALRTQQILAFESGVTDTVDPLGGSYYVEALTDRIEGDARELIRQIEEAGGMLVAIERGLPQRIIVESAYREARAMESGEKVVVGVNRYAHTERVTPARLRIDTAVAQRQKQRLARVRAERDAAAVERTLAGLRDAAAGSGPIMEAVIEAVRAYATLGEICNVLRAVFGLYRPVALV
jgi:methylmalonyl-CoA mutase N-terminal domain/subunit